MVYVVLVTGSRTWNDADRLKQDLLDLVGPERPKSAVTIVHGGCRTGADALASKIATEQGWAVKVYAADWVRHGRSAGPRRNAEMVRASNPHAAVVCLRGVSIGTKQCATVLEKWRSSAQSRWSAFAHSPIQGLRLSCTAKHTAPQTASHRIVDLKANIIGVRQSFAVRSAFTLQHHVIRSPKLRH